MIDLTMISLERKSVVPLQIQISEIESMIMDGTPKMKKGQDIVDVEDLAPDLCLLGFDGERINFQELVIEVQRQAHIEPLFIFSFRKPIFLVKGPLHVFIVVPGIRNGLLSRL